MQTIASNNAPTATIQLSLDLNQLVSHLADLETETLTQVVRSLVIELSQRQEIPLPSVLKALFSEKTFQEQEHIPDWNQWFIEVDELSSAIFPPNNLAEDPLLNKYRKQGLKI